MVAAAEVDRAGSVAFRDAGRRGARFPEMPAWRAVGFGWRLDRTDAVRSRWRAAPVWLEVGPKRR